MFWHEQNNTAINFSGIDFPLNLFRSTILNEVTVFRFTTQLVAFKTFKSLY